MNSEHSYTYIFQQWFQQYGRALTFAFARYPFQNPNATNCEFFYSLFINKLFFIESVNWRFRPITTGFRIIFHSPREYCSCGLHSFVMKFYILDKRVYCKRFGMQDDGRYVALEMT